MSYEIDSRGVKIKCRRCGGWHYYDDSMGIDLIALCMDCIAKEAVAAARSEKGAREQHEDQAVRSSAWLECASWLEDQARKVRESIRPLWPATDKARLEREAARIEGWASELRAHSNAKVSDESPRQKL